MTALLAGCGSDTIVGTGGGGGGSSCEKEIRGNEIQMEAFIEALLANRRLTVCASTVAITDSTEIRGDHGEDLDYSQLLVGMSVEMEGTLEADDTITARRIEVQSRDDSSSSIALP